MASPGTHSKCGAWKRRDGKMLFCSRPYRHLSPQCHDSNHDEHFVTSTS